MVVRLRLSPSSYKRRASTCIRLELHSNSKAGCYVTHNNPSLEGGGSVKSSPAVVPYARALQGGDAPPGRKKRVSRLLCVTEQHFVDSPEHPRQQQAAPGL